MEIFKHIYVYVKDLRSSKELDALDDGANACAYVVSGVFALFGLIDRPHATVATTLARMQESGWVKTDDPEPGDIVQWASSSSDHGHIAFYIGAGQCIGNITKDRKPGRHSSTLTDGREPIAYYTHSALRQG